MAKYGSDSVAFLLFDGLDVVSVSSVIRDEKMQEIEETTPLGTAWAEHSDAKLGRFNVTQEGWYDDATGLSNEALVSKEGTNRVANYGYAGNVIGADVLGFEGLMQANYQRLVTRGELHKANASFQGSGRLEEAKILHALGAETADGDTESSGVDNSASSAAGGAGYVQLKALTLGGFDDITIKVRHSTDDITYADLITFTALTAVGAERVAVAGTVNRYLASSWAFTGAGSGQSATFLVAFARF